MTERANLDIDNTFKNILRSFITEIRPNRPIFFFPTDIPGDGVPLGEGPVDDKPPSAPSDRDVEFRV